MRFPTLTRALIHTLFLTALTALPCAAWAVEVSNLNDSGAGSLRQAVIDTADAGLVTFQSGLSGTITLSSGEIALAKGLTIYGPGYGLLAVKAASGQRIFRITGSGAFTVEDLTLQGGGGTVADDGGLIHSVVDLTIRDCVLEDGQASGDGGAVFLDGGKFSCYDSIFQNNISTGGNGGAIRVEDSTESYYVSRTTFFSNAAYANGGAVSVYNVTSGSMYSCTANQNDAAAGNGGALSVVSGDLTVNVCSIFNNEAVASHGGGIYASGCGLLVQGGSQISSNTAAEAGGGIYSSLGSVTVENSTINGNTANGHDNGVGGGGIAKVSGSSGTYPLDIRNSTVSGNQANGGLAGGVYGGCSTNFRESTFHDNQSQGNGGGAYLAGDWIFLQESTFSRNISGGAGGGLFLPDVGTNYVVMEQCTFWYNEADTDGGGIDTGRTTYLYACTITENLGDMDLSGSHDGGGAHATGSLFVHGSIVARNRLAFAGGITSQDDCAVSGTCTGTYSLLGVGDGCSGMTNGVDGNMVGSIVAPVLPLLSGLADNGGPTQTCALLQNSPARDAFLDCDDLGTDKFTSDQRGMPRPRGTACDMGSFEAGASAEGVMYLLIHDQI